MVDITYTTLDLTDIPGLDVPAPDSENSRATILLARSEKGLCALFVVKDCAAGVEKLQREFPGHMLIADCQALADDMTGVIAVLEGHADAMALGWDFDFIIGTDFQRTVWSQLAQIPFGETRSYQEVAQAIGKPDAARAVGNACGANPLAVVVPCHRVVNHDGGVGHYAYGSEMKSWLLDMEHNQLVARTALETQPILDRKAA